MCSARAASGFAVRALLRSTVRSRTSNQIRTTALKAIDPYFTRRRYRPPGGKLEKNFTRAERFLKKKPGRHRSTVRELCINGRLTQETQRGLRGSICLGQHR